MGFVVHRLKSKEEEEQEQKRAAAAGYDYEGDARWADYWSNVVDHSKRKFYQLHIDRDLVGRPHPVVPPSRAGRK